MMKANQARAYCLEDGGLVSGAPERFFPFLDEPGHVISLVGGGGKTTTMRYLAACFERRGMKTAAMTTTKIGCPQEFCDTMEECLACWHKGKYAVCGRKGDHGKLDAPDAGFLQTLFENAQAIVIEADGAKRLPCKAPAAHEPVILPQSDIVIAVMGMDALGKTVGEICHRSERVQELLGCSAGHRLTQEDMVSILLSEHGSRKDVGERTFIVVLNKCDDDDRLEAGRRMLELLKAQGQEKAVLTCHPIKE